MALRMADRVRLDDGEAPLSKGEGMEWGRWYLALCLMPFVVAPLLFCFCAIAAKLADERMKRNEHRHSETQDASQAKRHVRHAA
jgi:hypothetical protein